MEFPALIQELARRRPGKLLRRGLNQMAQIVDPYLGVTGGVKVDLPPSATQYFQQVLSLCKREQLSVRDQRELKTLAVAMDLLTQGKFGEVGDLLMQRFKSVEQPRKEVGEQQELIPATSVSASSLKEKEIASRAARYAEKLKKHTGDG